MDHKGKGKTNALLNLIQKQDNDNLIYKIYLYTKDLSEAKYQFLIKKREDAGIKKLDDPSAFIEYSNTMDDVYNSIDDYNPKRKRKILIVFDDMIADVMTNKKSQTITIYFLHAENRVYLLYLSHSFILEFQKMSDQIPHIT